MRDVVIVGGGPVGVFLAALLAERGLDVCVWEKRQKPARLSRAIGIHPPALAAFARIGIAEAVADAAVQIRRGVARSGGRTLGTISFEGVHDDYDFIASLPQSETEAIIRDRLESYSPGAVQQGVELLELDDVDPDRVRLHGRSEGRDVYEVARFVVGADGARSTVRHLLGVHAELSVYDDPYVMADFRDDTGDGDDAVVHLERDGVVESFPLPGGVRRFVVYTGTTLTRPTAADVASLVTQRVGVPVDPSTATMVSAFVTRRRFADHLVRGRVSLIGDAAHEISPIGGQGMNLGWLDALELAPLLVAGSQKGHLDEKGFADFERTRIRHASRAADQAETNMALGRPAHGLRRLARNAGMGLALSSPARRSLARAYTMARR